MWSCTNVLFYFQTEINIDRENCVLDLEGHCKIFDFH